MLSPVKTLRPVGAADLGDPSAAEDAAIGALLRDLAFPDAEQAHASQDALRLVERIRAGKPDRLSVETLLAEFPLSSEEGVALMQLAEALLRIPDPETASRLIADKLGGHAWRARAEGGNDATSQAAGLALSLAGKLAGSADDAALRGAVGRLGAAVVRRAIHRAISILANQFVLGHTIDEALARARPAGRDGVLHSYDMLGEGARTDGDAQRYFEAYQAAIHAIGAVAPELAPEDSDGISVKLSALHPRYEEFQRDRVMQEVLPRIAALCRLAARYRMNLTVDAEESERLELSIEVFRRLAESPELDGWSGLGLAIQAYQKRAPATIRRVIEIARACGKRLMVRLVKGAYWDSEIKRAQELGLPGYPVYTRKAGTDLSYLACAAQLLAARPDVYPQFATHNAYSVAAVRRLAGDERGYEFQRLHGMGEPLYRAAAAEPTLRGIRCRVYAPVGHHPDLLAYLVRRLLENGANSSFVNRIADRAVPAGTLVVSPVATMRAAAPTHNPRIPLPEDLFAPTRRNSAGPDIQHPAVLEPLLADIAARGRSWHAVPLVAGLDALAADVMRPARPRVNPADTAETIGSVVDCSAAVVPHAVDRALEGFDSWRRTTADARAALLERAADLMEAHRAELLGLCIAEAGKTLPDAVAELREAVDFCRYYAEQARARFGAPIPLPGPTGESNTLALQGRGVFVCISPWNFPLAIFIGQVAAALAAGNSVIAKPAAQTPLVAYRATRLMHEAGIPDTVLQTVFGGGRDVGMALVSHPGIAGVAFTGSTETAWLINRALAGRDAPIAPLIAETGGQNAMIVDSTALPEQVTDAVVSSAFRSAGQRCSALRILFLQADIADRVIEMIAGAAAELAVGDPSDAATDVGPVIDAAAREGLEAHAVRMRAETRELFTVERLTARAPGHFFAPRAFEIDRVEQIGGEKFGPILHVIRYRAEDLDAVIDEINRCGFGLTLGIHTRIESRAEYIRSRVRVGNVYVNRNIIGAVVGVQPFGGQGLSGTGPKAGGPHYLLRFATEQTFTVNTAAAGGNASLMAGTEPA